MFTLRSINLIGKLHVAIRSFLKRVINCKTTTCNKFVERYVEVSM